MELSYEYLLANMLGDGAISTVAPADPSKELAGLRNLIKSDKSMSHHIKAIYMDDSVLINYIQDNRELTNLLKEKT